MADESEMRPPEKPEAGEGSEQAASRKLDDATFEPRAAVEQTGDYKQAEAIQAKFIPLVENTVGATEARPAALRQGGEIPVMKLIEGTQSAALRQASGESGFPKQVAGEVSAPLRQTAPETGFPKQVAGEDPATLRQTAHESGFPKQAAGELPTTLRQTAGEAVIGAKELGQESFAAVKAYVTGFHASGAGAGTSGNLDYRTGAGAGASQNNAGGVQESKLLGQSVDRGSTPQSPADVWASFTDYCKDAYKGGDRPADGNVEGWIADKGGEYFGNLPGTKDLLALWKQLASENKKELGKTIVTREDGGSDEPGTSGGGGGDSDEPGTSGGSKGGPSSTTDDDDDDDDDEDDDSDDDDDDDGGDGDDEPGEDGGRDDEPGSGEDGMGIDGGGDDSGHGQGPILKGGGSSGGGDEQEDTGHRTGVAGGKGSSGGGGEGSEDDTGKKGGIFGGGAGKVLSDNQAGPVDPIGPAGNLFGAGSDKLNDANVKQQTGKV